MDSTGRAFQTAPYKVFAHNDPIMNNILIHLDDQGKLVVAPSRVKLEKRCKSVIRRTPYDQFQRT